MELDYIFREESKKKYFKAIEKSKDSEGYLIYRIIELLDPILVSSFFLKKTTYSLY